MRYRVVLNVSLESFGNLGKGTMLRKSLLEDRFFSPDKEYYREGSVRGNRIFFGCKIEFCVFGVYF